MSVPHCGNACDFDLLESVGPTYFWVCAAIVLLTGVLSFTLRRQRWAWFIPVGGIILILAGYCVAEHVSRQALLF